MNKQQGQPRLPDDTQIVFIFQGGGALGSYQVGVSMALMEEGYMPNWMIGTSIGAINASILAGNKPEDRIDRLKQFWEYITSPNLIPPEYIKINDDTRKLHNFLSAQRTLLLGQRGFFTPRLTNFWNPFFHLYEPTDTFSFYDTSPLYQTLEKFIDFDLLNYKKSKIRLSLGAVQVRTGKLVYFDNKKEKIKPEHIMASGALPPGFPAIEVEGEMYWDGGLSSNTPINHLLTECATQNILCFMINLFDSHGLIPKTIDDVLKRRKDIRFSSQYRTFIQISQELHNLRYGIHYLTDKLTNEYVSDTKVSEILKNASTLTMNVVRFHYRGKDTDLSSKDFEFSHHSITEHRTIGYRDAKKGLEAHPWSKPIPDTKGIAVHEIASVPIEKEITPPKSTTNQSQR